MTKTKRCPKARQGSTNKNLDHIPKVEYNFWKWSGQRSVEKMNMRSLVIGLLAVLLLSGCARRGAPTPEKGQTPQSVAELKQSLNTLTGVVIRKGWTKSMESWNAGGSEYYVLKVDESVLPSDKRTAKEGVILRPSKAIPFDHFTNFVGHTVICRGEFVAGKPYIPPDDSVEQMPSPSRNPVTGAMEYPIAGSGFKVYAIEPVKKE